MELLASRRKVVQQLNNLAHTMPALGIQVTFEVNYSLVLHFKLLFRLSSNTSRFRKSSWTRI